MTPLLATALKRPCLGVCIQTVRVVASVSTQKTVVNLLLARQINVYLQDAWRLGKERAGVEVDAVGIVAMPLLTTVSLA